LNTVRTVQGGCAVTLALLLALALPAACSSEPAVIELDGPAPATTSCEADPCMECAEDSDCTDAARPHCSFGGACVQCAADVHCSATGESFCVAGRCHECRNDADCEGDEVCDQGSGECGECPDGVDCEEKMGCTGDDECEGDDVCNLSSGLCE